MQTRRHAALIQTTNVLLRIRNSGAMHQSSMLGLYAAALHDTLDNPSPFSTDIIEAVNVEAATILDNWQRNADLTEKA